MKIRKFLFRQITIIILLLSIVAANTTLAYAAGFNGNYSLSGTSADKMVSIATAQIGRTRGGLGYSDPWCARFVSDVAAIAGEKGAIPYNAGCRQLYNAIIKAGGKDVFTPQKGDIVFFICTKCRVNGYNNAYSHVGIVINSNKVCISGNYDNKVARHSVNSYCGEPHSVSSGDVILKYVRPNYKNSTSFNTTTPQVNPTTLSVNTSNITLNLANKENQTITLTIGGDLPNNCKLHRSISNSNIVSDEWVNYTGGVVVNSCITGKRAGTATITYTVTDGNTEKVYATKAVTVTVEAPSYTVQYNANGGTNAPGSQVKTYQKVLTLSSARPTRTGYTFNGWSTSPNGSVQYRPGDQYSADKNLTLYAVWSLNAVTIDADASTVTLDLAQKSSQTIILTLGGPVEDNCQLKATTGNSNVAVSNWDNYQSGSVVHAIITGKAAGTTTITYSLVDNNTQKSLATKTVAVTVKAPSYTIQYNANGGTNAPGSQVKTYQKALTLSSARPTRTGYTFNGWSTSPNGSVQYRPGDQYSADKNLTLYAVWSLNAVTIDADVSTVTLDLAQKSSQTIILTLGGPVEDNCQLKATTGNSNVAVSNWDNYQSGSVVHAIITGKAAGATTITYSLVDNNTQKSLATKTVAVTVKAPSYTIQYNANGGTNAPGSQVKTYQKALALSSARPTRTGYTFNGWSTSPNGSVQYHPGDQYSADKDLTLYAVWSLNSITIDSDISNIALDLPGKSSQAITLTLGGPVENNCQLKTSTSNPSVAISNWNNYQSGTIVHAIITAKSAGTTTITYSLVDINTQQTLASKRITVTVRANTDVVTFQGHSYQVFDDSMTWEEAKAVCAAKGGHLASITSQAEQDFIGNLLSSHSKFFYWLGASDTRREGTWEWVTGEAWNYKNWLRGQPDNHSDLNGKTENYLAMERVSKKWNDLQNAGDSSGNSRLQNGGYICEWDN